MSEPDTSQSKKRTSTDARFSAAADTRLKFISQTHRKAFDTRRSYEWKTVAATLAFYMLVSAASLRENLIPHGQIQHALVVGGIAAIAAASIYYLCSLHRANEINKDIAHAAENALVDRTEDKNVIAARDAAQKASVKNWSLLGESSAIVAFAVACLVLLLRGT